MEVSCCICTVSFSENIPVSSTPCGHTFHNHCLMSWIEISSSCPYCRKSIDPGKVLKIYFNFNSSNSANSLSLESKLYKLEHELRAENAAIIRAKKSEIKLLIKKVDLIKKELNLSKKELDLAKRENHLYTKSLKLCNKELEYCTKEYVILDKEIELAEKEKGLLAKEIELISETLCSFKESEISAK